MRPVSPKRNCLHKLPKARRPLSRRAPSPPASGGLLIPNVESGLLGGTLETALDSGLQPGHQRAVAEVLPALLRFVDRHDHPASIGWSGRMEHLTFRQAAVARMHRCQ